MPNAAARRARKTSPVAATPVVDTPETDGVNIVSTLAVEDFQVEELGNYEFTRTGAGRKREPSPFDNHVQEWAGQGTRRIPVEDEDAAKDVVKALQKACEYRARGLEKRVEDMDGQLYVVFRINNEKARRAPRKNREAVDFVDSAETE